ncbi:MAG: hypothetical protein ACKV2T_06970 [Kofleriaceae bacterium]
MIHLVFVPPPTLAIARVTITEPTGEGAGLEKVAHAGAGVRKVSTLATRTATGWPLEVVVFAADSAFRVVAAIRVFDRVGVVVIDDLPAPADTWHVDVRTALEAIQVRFDNDPPLAIRDWWAG